MLKNNLIELFPPDFIEKVNYNTDVSILTECFEKNFNQSNIGYPKSQNNYNIKKLLGYKHISHSDSIKFGMLFENICKDLIKKIGGEVIEKNMFYINDVNYFFKSTKGKKQVDFLFKLKKTLYYAELKVNTELDSEKSKCTQQKISQFETFFSENLSKFGANKFVCLGILTCWYERENDMKTFIPNIVFMKDFFKIINCNISKSAYDGICKSLGNKIKERNELKTNN